MSSGIFNLSMLNQTLGFSIYSNSEVYSVASTGDINGDGKDDIIIGCADAVVNGLNYAGQVYVVFGASSFPTILNTSTLNGTNGFIINGIGYILGIAVASAGDINNDGKMDIMLSSPEARNEGEGQVYVIFGASSFLSPFNLLNLNGSNGFTINGIGFGNEFGSAGIGQSLAPLGDVNGDGKDDIIIGDPTSSLTYHLSRDRTSLYNFRCIFFPCRP